MKRLLVQLALTISWLQRQHFLVRAPVWLVVMFAGIALFAATNDSSIPVVMTIGSLAGVAILFAGTFMLFSKRWTD